MTAFPDPPVRTPYPGQQQGFFSFAWLKWFQAITTALSSVSSGGNTAILTNPTPVVTPGEIGLGTDTGIGNGSVAAVTTFLKGSGTGPTDPQTVVGYMKINVGGTDFWIPYVK